MSLHPIDMVVVIVLCLMVVGTALYARRYTKSVADFLSANRCAGRYLLTVASGMAGLGAVTIVAMWEKFYQGGFGAMHWGMMLLPINLVLALSGWVIYRYRQTRAMTLSQFLEMRYSRRFRMFAGLLCFTSGALNYGIFPAVTGRFFIYFLDLPLYATTVPGLELELNWTLGLVMAINLSIALLITLNGGQIAVMVSDWVQGQLCNICFLLMLGVLLWLVPWPDIVSTLMTAPPGHSKLNPFDQGDLPDFSPMFFFMTLVLQVYTYRVWQGSQAYNVSARTPHEAKMATVLAEFRGIITFMLVGLAAITAWVVMHGDTQPEIAAATHATLNGMGDEQMAKQLTTTVVMKNLLPPGVLGLLAAVVIMAAVSTDSTYLHSWGSVFVQDVVMPLRQFQRKPQMTQDAHLKALKWSIAGVAAFAWLFSMIFSLKEYIFMYFQLTGAIFTGGAGAVLIGGLYWKRGNTWGAWGAMVVGSVLAVSGVVVNNILWPRLIPYLHERYPDTTWIQSLPEKFWLNGVEIGFAVSLIAIATYVIISLVTANPKVDYDKLLHRGRYAVTGKSIQSDYNPMVPRGAVSHWLRKLGVTEEFTFGDKMIFAFKYAFFIWQFVIAFIGITIAYTVFGQLHSDQAWATWWAIFLCVTGAVGIFATVWFIIGGVKDLLTLFAVLKTSERDLGDDGSVTE
ncbi:MAG: sodium:solute symporter [Phycisphaeraceae bacterium]|nr:sodium:solute symporter [Phycisphaeraceae bacterium]